MRCEIVLLVENLDICRYFYRNTLKLGEPVTDSNFQVEFMLNSGTFLVLEKCTLPYLEHASSACCFTLEVDGLAGLAEHLENECCTVEEAYRSGGKKDFRVFDPEGNKILLSEKIC
jgi:hypothetical protein